MNIQTYQQQVKRTFPDLGSKLLNSIHCTTGIGTEILEEVTLALHHNDKVNLGEELADAQWYAANYATVHDIKLPEVINCQHPKDVSLREREMYYRNMYVITGQLQNIDKRELAYGKVLENKTERVVILFDFFSTLEFIALDHEINMDEYRHKVIKKLLLRYPLAEGFTSDRAINRDTKSERQVLEEGVSA
jgi:NTP pyrophosphatase (non-canonical NTP hydrolase)